ncbi:MAG: hypothetical protein AB4062_07810, partial [Crocosphaera sp.]
MVTKIWDGQASTLWNNALNWESDILPANGDDIEIGFGDTFTIFNGQNPLNELSILSFNSLSPFQISGGILTVSGSFTIPRNTIVSNGTLELNGLSSFNDLTQSNGTITGEGTLNINGDYSWNGGTQTGGGVTNVNGTLTFAGNTQLGTLSEARTLNLNDQAIWNTSGYLYV